MSGILSAANAAFQLSSTALQQVGVSSVEGPSSSTSFIDRWPVAAAGFSCLISTINAIAMVILGNTPMAVLAAISAIGCAFLTRYLVKLVTLVHLETYVQAFAQRVNDLSQIVLRLSDENKSLDTHTLSNLETHRPTRASNNLRPIP